MDWENKFSSIVKETEQNIAKAKKNLSNKTKNKPRKSIVCTSYHKPKKGPGSLNVTDVSASKVKLKSSYLKDWEGEKEKATTVGNMNASASIDVFHMQEQINSQNRTIEKLKHLVKSLDGERDYYKHQLSLLKAEINVLTSTMKHQPSSIEADLKVTRVKRELTQEMEKLKSMVHSFESDYARRTITASPRFDAEVWNIKENLTTNLEQVRYELSNMKDRIDRMEYQISADNSSGNRPNCFDSLDFLHKTKQPSHQPHQHSHPIDPILMKPLFSPTNQPQPSASELDMLRLRTAISSINTKIDDIERKYEDECNIISSGNLRPSKFSSRLNSHLTSLSDTPTKSFLDDDLNLSSDPSDLDDLSGDDDDDDDDDNDYFNQNEEYNFDDADNDADLLGLEFEKDRLKTSSFKKSYAPRKGRVEFDLSDSDFSDIEDVVAVDLDDLDLTTP